jgi:hypothetical protein
VLPGTSTPTTTSWVQLTVISVGWAIYTATAYDIGGNTIDTQVLTNPFPDPENGINNQDVISFSSIGPIHKIDISITTPWEITYAPGWYDGFGIDDLSFEAIPIPVDIDIKPGSDPNSINLGEQGILTVAILGSADFDVTDIDETTVALGGEAITTRGKAEKIAYSIEDVNGDDFDDFIAKFKVQDLVDSAALTDSTTELQLTALLKDGTPIAGTDSVRIVPP